MIELDPNLLWVNGEEIMSQKVAENPNLEVLIYEGRDKPYPYKGF